MKKAIINISNRNHSEWSDAEEEAIKAYCCGDAENEIIDFIPLITPAESNTNLIWGIVNRTVEWVTKVRNDGTQIAAVIADIPDPVTNYRFVKTCAFPCVISTFNDNGDFVSIREY